MATIILGGGCFWCTEAIFKRVRGVSNVVSGYSGGQGLNPTYEDVCSGETGFAEVIEVTYDPTIISFKEITYIFFKTHDPTTLNQQGNDVGTQYRSVIFYSSEEEKKEAQGLIYMLNRSGEYSEKIVTTLESKTDFYPAEGYHQDYFKNNPQAGYCRIIIDPKVKKFMEKFPDKIAIN